MMRTQAHSADRQQIHVDQNNSVSPHQINLPQKRKAPDSIDLQTSECQRIASSPPKITLKLKVPPPVQVHMLSLEPASSSKSSGTAPAASALRPIIRLNMPPSGVIRAPQQTAPAASEALVAPITQATVTFASPTPPQALTEVVASAEQALVNMNPLRLESSEPALKRRKTSEETRDLEDRSEGIDPEAQKEFEHFAAGNFTEALGKSDADHVEHCILSGHLKLESLDPNYRLKAFLMMISIGSREAVRALMKSGIDTRVLHSREGLAHLKWTISKGDWQMVRELLMGSPGNGCKFRYMLINLLHEVLFKGSWYHAKVLLKAGISPNQTSISGDTALAVVWKSIVAGWNKSLPVGQPINPKHIGLITRLIKAGANINQPLDPSGDTLLHKAFAGGYLVHVPWLLAKGADPEVRNARHQKPADMANPNSIVPAISSPSVLQNMSASAIPAVSGALNPAHEAQQRVAPALDNGAIAVQPAPRTDQRASGQAAGAPLSLFAAVASGRSHVLSALAKALDLDVNDQNEEGFTPLMVALMNGHPEAANRLLSMGANPYIVKPGTRLSAFTIAAMKGQTAVLSRLTASPEFAALKDITGVDALCAAVAYQQVEVVRLLRKAGVSPFTVGPTGRTAMMVNHHTPGAPMNMALQAALLQSGLH